MAIPNSKNFFENVIDEYQSIVTFAHVDPDGDAYGASMGLKIALQALYPGKKCYCVGTYDDKLPVGFQRPIRPEDMPLETIQNSLVIICDTATVDRIEDKRALQGKYVVKIDHHAPDGHFGDIEFVDETKSSCSLIVTDMLFASFPIIPANAASALLFGIFSDTDNLKLASEGDDYFKTGRLIYNGADIQSIFDVMNRFSLRDIELRKDVLERMKVDGQVAYCLFTKDEIQALGTTRESLLAKINTIGYTIECPIWAFFLEREDGTVRAEFRCTRNKDVSKVASSHNGGGHKQVSGARLASLAEVSSVVEELKNI